MHLPIIPRAVGYDAGHPEDTFNRMGFLSHLKARFTVAPPVLRIVVAASISIGIAFPLLPFVPGATFHLGERELSSPELWQTRVALALIVVGLFMLILGVAVLLRQRWARPLLVFLPVLQIIPFVAVQRFFGAPSAISSAMIFTVSCVAWAVVATLYLFGSASSRRHFGGAL